MAEETTKTAEPAPSSKEVLHEPEKSDQPPPPQPDPEVSENPAQEEKQPNTEEADKAEPEKVTQLVSYKEESNVAGELPDPQKKALEEFKQLVQQALNKHEFTAPETSAPEEEKKEEEIKEEAKSETEQKPAEASEKVETEAPPPAEPKEEDNPAPTPVKEAQEVSEKAPASAEDDGAKTVEAIEATVISAAETEQPSASAETETPTEAPPAEVEETPAPPPEEVFIWGIPLLADERSDVILLKFLRARDFKVKEALAMLKSTILWRKEFGIDSLVEEELGNEFDKFVFTSGMAKEGHPVCYNVYGGFQDKESYQNSFSDEEKRTKFLRWRIQFMEKSIRKLDFSPTGINTIFQVNDLNNSFWPAKKEIRQTTNQALQLFQDNYPEFVAKQVFINVPWWYLAFNRMMSPFLTQRTKSKFVFAGPSKTADTLFRYISPEQVPVQYGGLSKEGEEELTSVTEVTIKPATKHTVEISVPEKCVVVWEFRVVGWEVSYGAEFVPGAEDGYTVIVSKTRKVVAGDEPVIGETFKAAEPGKVVLTIDNQTSKKKKLLYRSKTKPHSD